MIFVYNFNSFYILQFRVEETYKLILSGEHFHKTLYLIQNNSINYFDLKISRIHFGQGSLINILNYLNCSKRTKQQWFSYKSLEKIIYNTLQELTTYVYRLR